MAALTIVDMPDDLMEQLDRSARASNQPLSTEVVRLLRQSLDKHSEGRTQAELLADLRRRSHCPPPGAPDSVQLLREDRDR